MFGSYAKGTATEDSDVDLLIDPRGAVVRGMFAWGGVYEDFQIALKKNVDIILQDSLESEIARKQTPSFVQRVERERVVLYERA